MTETIATLNEETAGNGGGAESSTAPALNTGDLVETIVGSVPDSGIAVGKTDTDPEAANNTEGSTDAGAQESETEDPDKGTSETKDTKKDEPGGEEGDKDADAIERYVKIPRFKELREKADRAEKARQEEREARIRSETRLEALEELQRKGDTDGGVDKVINILDMSDEEIEELKEDPKAFAAVLARQIRHELQEERVQTDRSREQEDFHAKSVKTYDAFSQANEGFEPMWNSGKLKDYMDQNPGHNAISAYLVLTDKERIDAAVSENTKALTEKFEKEKKDAVNAAIENMRAKRGAGVLGEGPGAVGPTRTDEVPPELKDTKQHGGMTRALLSGVLRRRAAAAGGTK